MNEQTSETDNFRARARARSEAKNAAARAELEPLESGERPVAVTVAAIVAMVFAVFNVVVIFFVDVDADNEGAALAQQLFIAALLAVAAVGMWRAKYWAVLGFQTILGITVIVLFLLLLKASSIWVLLPFIAMIVGFSTLFWHLIRAMARIQMPESPAERKLREHRAAQDLESEASDDE
ncbi:MAG: hypothetical protein HZB14_06455 [Actinobacteria bacterium]|nr:hypothetical protein [Actinomycetota bacterium]